jgi:hypothetical protein
VENSGFRDKEGEELEERRRPRSRRWRAWSMRRTMEHLLCACANYSSNIWAIAGCTHALTISRHTGQYIPSIVLIVLTPLEIMYVQQAPSISSPSS